MKKLNKRLRAFGISALALCVTLACSLLRRDRDGRVRVTCYTVEPPTKTPEVLCYEMVEVTETPTPTLTCYTATPRPSATATPSPEARAPLLERLLAEGRFPPELAETLED